MEVHIDGDIYRSKYLIQPVKKVQINPRESNQEQYAAKKKPDTKFSEVLSGELASVATKTSPQIQRKMMNDGLSVLNSLAIKRL